MKNKKTLNLVISALFSAIIFILTFINIRLPFAPNGGLIHLGGIGLIIAIYLLNPLYSGLSGAIGMTLFDIMGGYTIWAPFTFVIRFFQGFIASKMIKKDNVESEILGLVVCVIIEMAGYYIAECILYGNFIVPFSSMPGELILNTVAIVVGVPIAKALIRNKIYYKD